MIKELDNMEKITILNPHRDSFEVDVLRYFVMGDAKILLYTLNESDGDGNVRLYVTKIVDGLTQTLTDEEWTLVKASIRTIVAENREGKPLTVRDLNYKEVEGIVVEHLKVFKLAGEVLEDLAANKTKYEAAPAPSVIPVSPVDVVYSPSYINPQVASKQPEELSSVNSELNVVQPEPQVVSPEVMSQPEMPSTQVASIDYKAMYEEMEKEKKKLEEEILDLQNQTLSYQLKYDQIKKILEGQSLE